MLLKWCFKRGEFFRWPTSPRCHCSLKAPHRSWKGPLAMACRRAPSFRGSGTMSATSSMLWVTIAVFSPLTVRGSGTMSTTSSMLWVTIAVFSPLTVRGSGTMSAISSMLWVTIAVFFLLRVEGSGTCECAFTYKAVMLCFFGHLKLNEKYEAIAKVGP